MLRIAALDDERHALERFGSIAEEFEDIESCKLFDEVDELLAYLENNPLDVIFLDVEMPGKSGLELAGAIREKNPAISVVFATAFSQYAVEAFELNALDYIMKPVTKERLKKTLDRITKSNQLSVENANRVSIRCFPRFECRIDNKVIPLNQLMKGKELLAFLVSRRGAETSWEQITEALWPDADFEKAHNNLYITTFRLRKWLSENGIPRIFESRRNSYRVIPFEFSCDLFDMEKAYEEGDGNKLQLLYRGEFLEEEGYQWAYSIRAEWAIKINHFNAPSVSG